jgi:hypothetical protein
MEHLPFYVYATFGATVLFATWLFFKAANYSKLFLIVLTVWVIIQSLLSLAGFYINYDKLTARIPFILLPPILCMAFTFGTNKGRAFIDSLDLPMLTLFHVIRIPVEIVLFWLFINNSIPEAMTFHGRNFDIFSGLSAPVVYYFGFIKKTISKTAIVVWNLICLALLVNIVSTAILALPGRYQHYGFEQPNIAVGYFPFVLLPACLVPLVLFSTLAAIRQLLKRS